MGADRFKPVRAGIIGIWDYNEQIFEFADGRLVLRGANGSGKTKALEVLVPFVLDGSVDARRLDPFSSKQRTMKSNLLFGDQKIGHGYCWLELARGEETVTVGVGLRAQETSSGVTTWFFVADGVVGRDIRLLSESRVPLGRRELREQLGTGRVVETRLEHQRAVDRRLFGLGPDRYQAMLELVLTLRRPQLAKDLDPDLLSDVLSDGLRTVDEDLLRTSAQAFDDLDAAQRELSELERAERAVQDLLTHWRIYLRARAAQRVARVEEMQGRVRRTEHEIEDTQRHIEREARKATDAEARERGHREEAARLGAAMEGLKRSSAYQGQHQLEDVRNAARLAADGAARAERAADEARQGHGRAISDQQAVERDLESARAQVERQEATLRAQLRLAGIAAEGALHIGELRADLVARTSGVDAVLEQVERLDRATADLLRAEGNLQQAMADLEAAERRVRAAREHLDAALAAAEVALGAWFSMLPPDIAEQLDLSSLFEMLPELGAGADLAEVVRARLSPLRDDLLTLRSQQEIAAGEAQAGIDRCATEIVAIRAERQDAPPAPPTRAAGRGGRVGAPLWRLVRFRPEVSEGDQAGLEGALLAAGLLDAWVEPGEGPSSPDLEDTWLRAWAPVSGPSLREVLEPEPEAGVPAAQIEALLASVALEQASVAVLPDGRFTLGPLAGCHHPAQVRYIGATARARHRAERIADLEHQRARLAAELDALLGEVASLGARIEAIDLAPRGLPPAAPARKARGDLQRAEAKGEQSRALKDRAADACDQALRVRDEARFALRCAAAEHGTPDEPEALRELRRHLVGANQALGDLERMAELRRLREDAFRDAGARGERAMETLRKAEGFAHEAKGEHEQLAARLQAIEATLGVELQLVLAKISELERRRSEEERQRVAAEKQRSDAELSKAHFVGAQIGQEKLLPEQRLDLERAEVALAPFELPEVLGALQVVESADPFTARLAAAVQDASFTDEQIKTTETKVTKRLDGLDQELGSRFHSLRWTDDGVVVVQVQDELGRHGLAAFSGRLRDRLEMAHALLAHEEQKLFEDQLLGALCGQMRDRMSESRQMVEAMDRAMRARRLASKKSLGIAWRSVQDAPPERKELLGLLQFDPSFQTPDRLARIRQLLSEEVQAARQERPDRDYLEILVDALNYRRWHRFELTLFEPDGSQHRLSKNAHSRLSGGEKAATLHLPLFAAAHAHFSAAQPDCPRLVAMDEAFAGIDETGVPELLRLAHEFDLDFFLTGHDLWVTEPFLPGVMHYDLVHDPVTRAVSAWPILWNGQEVVQGRAADPWNAPS